MWAGPWDCPRRSAISSRSGWTPIRRHEQRLTELASDQLSIIPGVRIYGPPPRERSGVVSFTVEGVHPHDLATVLDHHQVCVRAGHHCAQPLMRRLGVPATARASFFIYNDTRDVDALVAGVQSAQRLFAEPGVGSIETDAATAGTRGA